MSDEGNFIILAIIIAVVVVVAVIGFGILGWGAAWVNNGAQTAHTELDPSALLAKYRIFLSDQHSLVQIKNNVEITEKQVKTLEKQYDGIPRAKWARDDREQWSDLTNSLTAQKMNFNRIAKDYNMRNKDQLTAFMNVATLPVGASEVLTREFALYIDV